MFFFLGLIDLREGIIIIFLFFKCKLGGELFFCSGVKIFIIWLIIELLVKVWCIFIFCKFVVKVVLFAVERVFEIW